MTAEINLIPGEKLIIKMWESVFDKGIGSLLSPWKTRRTGAANLEVDRMRLLVLAQAENDANEIRAGRMRLLPTQEIQASPVEPKLGLEQPPELALVPRADDVARDNVMRESVRREISIARAVLFAEEELRGETQEPSAAPISGDWLLRWRDNAAGVSSDELQSLWGRVLAGEVKAPGSFSLRTLDFLRNISKEDAELILAISPFVIEDWIFREDAQTGGLWDQHVEFEKFLKLDFAQLLELDDLGIISTVDGMGIERTIRSSQKNSFHAMLLTDSKVLVVKSPNINLELKLPIYLLTRLGREVLRLGKTSVCEGYVRGLGARIKLLGFEVAMGDKVAINATTWKIGNLINL